MTAYLSYLAGDVFGLSGILALFVCAVAISHYALNIISGGCWAAAVGISHGRSGCCCCCCCIACTADGYLLRRCHRLPSLFPRHLWLLLRSFHLAVESRTTTIYAFHTLSYVSEGVIFVYCGLDALDPLKWQVGWGRWED